MRFCLLRRSIAGVAVLGLAACGSPPAAPGGSAAATGATPLAAVAAPWHAIARRTNHRSWMSPEAKSENLMYVSDGLDSQVDVFSYPKGKLVGTIGGFSTPQGMCADKNGNVWITSSNSYQIFEFAHGGTTPIVTLALPGPQIAVDCSVDPSSGNLAVTSFCEYSPGKCIANGSVFVYTDLNKSPAQYFVGDAENVYFCGYDNAGNLFVDAYEGPSGPTVLGELVKGASSIELLTVDRPIYFPGGVQWDGKHIAVGDQEAGNKFASSVHQLTVKGSNATVVGTTRLQGVNDGVQFWIQGKTIVVPNYALGAPNDARVFSYPAGGSPRTIFGSGDFEEPIGSVVSLATKPK